MPRRPPPKPPEDEAAETPLAAEPPRAPSRWKHFFLEFLSVAAGVLLALVVDQAAENWREHRRVVDQREAMDEEIGEFSEIFGLRLRATPCIDAKLDALEAFVLGRGPAGPVVNIGRPPFFFSGRGGWNSNAGDQLARYLGADRFQRYSELYQGMEQYSAINAEEQVTWVPLQALERDPDAMTPERRTRLREAIAQARNEQLLMKAIAEQMIGLAKTLGIRPAGDLRDIKARIGKAPICTPLSTAAAGAPGVGG